MIRDCVREAWVKFNTPMEGMLPFPYLDRHVDPKTKKPAPLLTVGMGNMIEGPEGLALPWTILGLRLATDDEIAEGLAEVKARADLAPRGGAIFEHVSNLRLAQADINTLIFARLDENDAELAKYFPNIDQAPADAEMGTHSMAWAMGEDFDQHDAWPAFTEAVNAGDWIAAAIQSHMYNGAPARNIANHSLFVNAAVVVADGLDPDVLIWPAYRTLPPPASGV